MNEKVKEIIRPLIPALAVALAFVAFDMFRQGVTMNLAQYRLGGVILLILAFLPLAAYFLFYTGGREEIRPVFTQKYAPTKPLILFAKIAIAVGFIVLAEYFLNAGKRLFFVLSCAGAVMQSVFLFRIVSVEQPGTGSGQEQASRAFNLKAAAPPAALFLIAFIIAGLTLKSLWLWNIKWAMVGFVACAFMIRKFYDALPAERTGFNPRMGILDWLFVAAVTAAAYYIRQYHMTANPPGASLEEGLTMMTAGSVVKNGARLGIWLNNVQFQVSSLYYYIVALWYRFAEINLQDTRLFSAAAGALNVVFIYLLAKEIFSRRVAVISSLVMAVMYFHIIYSRIGWMWVLTPLIATAAFYLYFLAERKGSMLLYALSGALLSVNIYLYNAGKLAPMVLAVYWLVRLIDRNERKALLSGAAGIFTLVFSASLLAVPLVMYVLKDPVPFFAHLKGQNIFRTVPNPVDFVAGAFFVEHMLDTVLLFTVRSGSYGYFNFPGKPLFDGLSSFFLVAGSAFCLAFWKRKNISFLVAWVTFSFVAAVFSLHDGDPNTQRMILVAPAMALLIAIGFSMAWDLAESLHSGIARAVMPVALAFFMLISGYDSLHTYFTLYAESPAVQSAFYNEPKVAFDEIVRNRDAKCYTSYYFGGMDSLNILVSTSKVDNTYIDLPSFDTSRFYNNENKDAFILAEGIYRDFMGIFADYFPGAVITPKWNYNYKLDVRNGFYSFRDTARPEMYFITARIPYKAIEAAYCIRAVLRTGGNSSTADLKEAGFDNPGNIDSADLKSLIFIPEPGRYSFEARGAGACSVFIDDRPHANGAEISFGLHRFRARISAIKPGKTTLWWTKSNNESQQIPIACFLNADKVYGLTGKYKRDGKYAGTRIDPCISFRNSAPRPYGQGWPVPYDAEWTGSIDIPETGEYEFDVKAYYPVTITIDNRVVLKKLTGLPAEKTKTALRGGKHRIKINYEYKGSPSAYIDWAYLQVLCKKSDWLAPKALSYGELSPN